ncbi:hypothetical protein PAHAL_7G191000 [Panicum hallii]|uniref:Secreted protein n=1 Tax=Panicum hallii TaxID=206008 RepID=A0A2T8ICQ7_9POAL|nr:hypothetical protein PAHAL_7G191000 [Panicum hallii]
MQAQAWLFSSLCPLSAASLTSGYRSFAQFPAQQWPWAPGRPRREALPLRRDPRGDPWLLRGRLRRLRRYPIRLRRAPAGPAHVILQRRVVDDASVPASADAANGAPPTPLSSKLIFFKQ